MVSKTGVNEISREALVTLDEPTWGRGVLVTTGDFSVNHGCGERKLKADYLLLFGSSVYY